MSVVPFTGISWDHMIEQSATYAPFVKRLVGFFMLHDHRNDPDHDPAGTKALAAVPGLADLSADEQSFVWAGAMAAYYQDDVAADVREAYEAWIDEGAAS